jgi:phosphoglycerol transferase MdoB-like AlkP superfamily enzyme
MRISFLIRKVLRGRLALCVQLTTFALAIFLVTRLGLLANSADQAELHPLDVVRILLVGTLYDLSFCVYAFLPLALWSFALPEAWWRARVHQAGLRFISFAAVFGLCFVALAEVIFWGEFEVRFNFIAVDYLVYTREVLGNIHESYPVAWLLTGIGVLSLGIYRLLRSRITNAIAVRSRPIERCTQVVTYAVLLASTYLVVGQGVRQLAENPYQNELASNGPYQFFAAFRNNELDYLQFYPTLPEQRVDELVREMTWEPRAQFLSDEMGDIARQVDNPSIARPLNLVVIMVESLSADYLKRYGNQGDLTPCLDALAGKSLVFDRMYATGTRTTRGLEALTLSLPPTPGRSIVKRIGRESGFQSLGAVLDDAGYESSFVYGGRGFFDNMNAFFSGNGYQVVDQASVDRSELVFENAWGMSDEDLYGQVLGVADRAHAAGHPFFIHAMTTSNHRPFTYPEGRVEIPSGSGRAGAVRYTDYAIDELLTHAKDKPWFRDTVFLIVADHCASSAGKVDLPVERYHIPCMIYAPDQVAPRAVNTLASQVDLAPTLLALLGVSYQAAFFGKDILACESDEGRAFIGTYQLLGRFEDGVLSVLNARGELSQRREQGAGREPEYLSDRFLAERCIASYEGSSELLKRKLNHRARFFPVLD